jgi:hypothetical protein
MPRTPEANSTISSASSNEKRQGGREAGRHGRRQRKRKNKKEQRRVSEASLVGSRPDKTKDGPDWTLRRP